MSMSPPCDHRLCALDTIADPGSRGYTINQQGIFVVRQGQSVKVYRNLCPHAYIPLEWIEHEFLTLDKSLIQCANHGALFTIEEGQCIAGPCSGTRLKKIPAEVRDQQIYIALPTATI